MYGLPHTPTSTRRRGQPRLCGIGEFHGAVVEPPTRASPIGGEGCRGRVAPFTKDEQNVFAISATGT